MVFAPHVVKGEDVVLAPLGAKPGSPVEDGSTLVFNRMNLPTTGAGPSGVDDFDDLRRT